MSGHSHAGHGHAQAHGHDHDHVDAGDGGRLGLALAITLLFMAVAHCAYLLGVNLVAERFARDVEFRWTGTGEFLLALLGNPCALML